MTAGDPGRGQPPISDDGRFWWDGERWQPMAAAPPPLSREQLEARDAAFDRIARDLGRAQGCLTASLWLTAAAFLVPVVIAVVVVIWLL